MSKTILPLIVVLYLLAGGCNTGPTKAKQQRITISGAFALYPLTIRWAEEYQRLHPEIRIDISAGGAGKGLTDVLSGMVDLGMFSRDVTEAEKGKGTWAIEVAKDAVVATINSNNPVAGQLKNRGITPGELKKLFVTGEITNWSAFGTEKSAINVYTRSDACGAAEIWAGMFKVKQEQLRGTGMYGDPGMADVITKDPGSIGYNNIVYVYNQETHLINENMDVAPIDFDSSGTIEPSENFYNHLDSLRKAIETGRYPMPPARNLYLVSKGKPTNPAVQDFLKWILTEGQKYVESAGYVKLPADHAAAALKSLE